MLARTAKIFACALFCVIIFPYCEARKPALTVLYQWNQINFEFPSEEDFIASINSKYYVPENVIPLGVERWKERVFISTPRWRTGVPASLSTVPVTPTEASPALKPFPNLEFHNADNCTGLTSVFRMTVDPCGRLWVLDSGQVNAFETPLQLCPPQIVAFDLKTDKLIARYPIPQEFVLQNSLISNLIVDTRDPQCKDLHLYIADTWRFGLIVFRASDEKFWRFTHHTFFPDPISSNYTLHGVNYQWTDGIFGMSLSPIDDGDRLLFYHPLSGSTEFFVKTSILQDPTSVTKAGSEFRILGECRGRVGQVSAAAVDRNGVMFFNLISQDSVGCWDSKKPYLVDNLGIVAFDNESLIFPNDLRLDYEEQQRGWVISNRLPMYQFKLLRPEDTNFRLLYFNTSVVHDSICDPQILPSHYSEPNWGIRCC